MNLALIIKIVMGVVCIATGGLFFRKPFKKNKGVNFILFLTAIVSTYFVFREFRNEIIPTPKMDDQLTELGSTNSKQELKMFPVFGLTIGESTIADALSLGYHFQKKPNRKSSVCNINGVYFWDFGGDEIIDGMYMTHSDNIPDQWENLMDLTWSNSYNDWLNKLKVMGYNVEIEQHPATVKYQERKTLSAKFVATSPSNKFSLTLKFNYGNDNNEGYGTKSRNSLYSISVRSNTQSSEISQDQTDLTSIQDLNKSSKLFPLFGITLDETTVSEVEQLGFYPRIWENTRSSVTTVNGIFFWDHDEDQVIDGIYMTNSTAMPQQWQKQLDFDWKLSYSDWIITLQELGFVIIVKDEPKSIWYDGRKTLSAKVNAVSSGLELKLSLDFDYGNDYDEGYGLDSKNSLYSIKIRTLN